MKKNNGLDRNIADGNLQCLFMCLQKWRFNQEVYLKKCIQERLMPFIRKHHQHTQTVFWPDLASSHYANSVQNYLRDENVEFVPKEDNPAAAPEVRPIEDFWADLKRSVYSNDCKAKNITELTHRIKCFLKKWMQILQKRVQTKFYRIFICEVLCIRERPLIK